MCIKKYRYMLQILHVSNKIKIEVTDLTCTIWELGLLAATSALGLTV
jgi:hypothetical protein